MTADSGPDPTLKRTLDLLPALAIGMGTMIGAGIFVFPGLAAERAGTGAFFAFVVAGLIAFAVAICAAELATAMPRSGGVFFFVTHSLGKRWGFLAGLSQWLGLIFATSFYLVGFFEYFLRLMEQFGWSEVLSRIVLIAVVGGLLVTLNILGADWFGRVQKVIVGSLLLLLGFVITIGLLRMTGFLSPAVSVSEPFSKGISPTFSTAALIFTSYLGFVQITTVGGEIKDPGRNLPRALMGSVLMVTILYALTLFVATSVLKPEQLAEAGETGMITVAQQLLGPTGELVMLTAGLLAILSSANASILSGSRAIFALSQKGQAPKPLANINHRFGTPHYALLATGIPVVALGSFGPVELLAEVASCLHLVLYAAIGFVVVRFRRHPPAWYAPSFRAFGSPWIPALAGLSCIALIAFMSRQAIIVSTGLLILSGGVGWVILRRRENPDKRTANVD